MSNIFNPVNTYRVQFHKQFNFLDFEKVIPYLYELGIKTIYASPIFEAAPDSTHGYDGTNPNRINPEIGTLEQLRRISADLKKKNIAWIQDIVPNHLSYHQNNEWLMDVLENGKQSKYADYFDILWDHPDYPGRLMVPFPGSELENILKEKIPGQQNYVLCSWQETDYRMNYRRFFLVNTLICTNIHNDHVFQDYHQLIKQLIEEDVFQGVRVDHIDGLYDPAKYLKDLRHLCGEKAYIVVEKILEPGENMPEYWPIQGNSGYDFLGMVNNLQTNRAAEFDLTAFYYDLTGDGTAIEKQVHDKKAMILENYMRGELDNLVRLYLTVSKPEDIKLDKEEIRKNIAEYLIHCPVYRYYEDIPMMAMDEGKDASQMRSFYQRCMQFSGPLMAKGVEDTLMYTYNRFIGHNEVGDSPEFFGYEASAFHELMQYRQQHWPLGMNASSTHDTKRGEDARARLNALTDLHEEWLQLVKNWLEDDTVSLKAQSPDTNDRYFIFQTLAASYPYSPNGTTAKDIQLYPERLKEYLEKAMREAKVHSTWTEQNTEYEEGAIKFAHALLDTGGSFYKSFEPFVRKVVDYGMINSFIQLVLKFACPGVPDVYQGTELWDLSLVDPDNRRPVDYESRATMLKKQESWKELWDHRWDGAIKLQLLQRLIRMRSEHVDLFTSGEYIPLKVEGSHASNVIAFLRRTGVNTALVVAPLQYAHVHPGGADLLYADWKDTSVELPGGAASTWTDLINGGTKTLGAVLNAGELLREFPVAVYYA